MYKKLSSMVYNSTKGVGVSIDGDLEFYTQKLLSIDGNVLEFGVGNGRILIPLFRRGVVIEGIDISNEMLTLCQENCTKYQIEPNLYLGDLTKIDFNKKYEAIIIPNGTLCLIQDRKILEAILLKMKTMLTKSGKIYVDLIYPTSFKSGTKSEYSCPIDDHSYVEIKNIAKDFNWEQQYTLSEFEYNLYRDQQFVASEIQIFKLMWFGVNEFDLWLQKLGFKKIEIIKNYGVKKMLNLKTVTFIFN